MINKDKYIYDVDKNNIITAWEKDQYDAGEPPFLYQPTNPDNANMPFVNIKEATAWIEAKLDAMINPPILEQVIEE